MEKIRIPFNVPAKTGKELVYLRRLVDRNKYSGDGEFTRLCQSWFREKLGCESALLTPSCTHALELAALLIDIREGDEVIMPSFTFASTANAFALRGARVVFVDIRPDTMNMDESLIEPAITPRTRAIVPVHYAGVPCEMSIILDIARHHKLIVIEDAAQALMSTFKGRHCGTLGHLGCFSFHETKNIQCGEGGALIINDAELVERAEIIREKGTDRSRFYRGQVDKYTWRDIGSSYLPSELQAAFLYAQLEAAGEITAERLLRWEWYRQGLEDLGARGASGMPSIPDGISHNAHIFYLVAESPEKRRGLISFLGSFGIPALFHYIPLHTAPAGARYCRFHGEDVHTSSISERMLRLPLYHGMERGAVEEVTTRVLEFFRGASGV